MINDKTNNMIIIDILFMAPTFGCFVINLLTLEHTLWNVWSAELWILVTKYAPKYVNYLQNTVIIVNSKWNAWIRIIMCYICEKNNTSKYQQILLSLPWECATCQPFSRLTSVGNILSSLAEMSNILKL